MNHNLYSIECEGIIATFGIAWHRCQDTLKQTLFPVWDKLAHPGFPMEGVDYSLRATKGVNMFPFPVIRIMHSGVNLPYMVEEQIKVSIVAAHNKQRPEAGSCPCKGPPILQESKQGAFELHNGEIYCKIKEGLLELEKVQFACCSGPRGHGCVFCLKFEFVKEGSILKGKSIYSVPIEVLAKGPFSKSSPLPLNKSKTKKAKPTNQKSLSKRPSLSTPSSTTITFPTNNVINSSESQCPSPPLTFQKVVASNSPFSDFQYSTQTSNESLFSSSNDSYPISNCSTTSDANEQAYLYSNSQVISVLTSLNLQVHNYSFLNNGLTIFFRNILTYL